MLGIECEHSTVKALQVLDRNVRVSVHPISIKPTKRSRLRPQIQIDI